MDEDRYTEVRIRGAVASDARLIADMDAACRERPGAATDYQLSLGCKGFEVFIAESFVSAVGFISAEVYKPKKPSKKFSPAIRIWSFGVIPTERRKYVASQLMSSIRTLTLESGVRQIEVEVSEEALGAQLFLKNQNFRCVGSLKPIPDETWLKFVYRPMPTNRIAAYLTQAAGRTS